MRILISLVGEQPTPNLIPLFAETTESRTECIQFMISGDTRIAKVAGFLENAICKDPTISGIQISSPDFMDAWNLERARSRCEYIIRKYQDSGLQVTVNLTGGTKIMSLAAYQAAMNCHVPMLYVNTAESTLIHFDEQGRPQKPVPFRVKIPIETQLRAAGREFSRKEKEKTTGIDGIPKARCELVKWIVDHYPPAVTECILPVAQHINNSLFREKNCGTPFPRPYRAPLKLENHSARQVAQHLQDAGMWESNGAEATITTTDQWDFINGGWLEAYSVVALHDEIIRESLDEVLGPVFIEDFPEIDAIASKNGRLAIIECKLTGRTKEESLTEILGKLYAHEHLLGGPYGKSVFVRANPGDIKTTELTGKYQAELIIGPQLKDLGAKISEMLKT